VLLDDLSNIPINATVPAADYRIEMKKKKTSLGCLFWIALVLLVLIIFFFNRKNIENVIEKTGFKELIKKEQPAEKPEITVKKKEKGGEESTINPNVKDKTSETTITIEETQKKTTEPTRERKEERPKYKTRKSRIFFAQVDKEGRIVLKGTIRKITYIDAPLTRTLEKLMEGPNQQEVAKGLLNLIPRGTRIKNIYVKGDTAYIDFTEDFRFNPLGVEGLKNQLKQVVYTVTEFRNIKYVQILINGKKEDYLGPEGIYIGKPLSRESFAGNQ